LWSLQPRLLPTDDVLIVRKAKGKPKTDPKLARAAACEPPPPPHPWNGAVTLSLVAPRTGLQGPSAMVFESLDDVRWAAKNAAALRPHLRAVIAPHIPGGTVPVFAGLGILALAADAESLDALRRKESLGLPPPDKWNGDLLTAAAGESRVVLRWLAVGAERDWTASGTAHSAERQRS
jgi:hypothetical protein